MNDSEILKLGAKIYLILIALYFVGIATVFVFRPLIDYKCKKHGTQKKGPA